MDDSTFNPGKHRVTFWTLAIAGSAIVIAGLTAASMHTTAIKAEVKAQAVRVEPSASSEDGTTPVASEITPSAVIEPDPGFFVGAGDGSSGYYVERPAR